ELPPDQIEEVNANSRAIRPANEPPVDIHFDSAPTFYVNNQPDRSDPAVRGLERDVAATTAIDPYVDPANPTPITRSMIDTVGEKAVHMINADPNRTPTFTLFANPDYIFQT